MQSSASCAGTASEHIPADTGILADTDPEDEAIRADRVRRLEKVLAKLSPKARAIREKMLQQFGRPDGRS